MNPYSCVQTIELLRNLALNIHGMIDVVDDQNIKDIIELLKKQEGYKVPEPDKRPVCWP